MWKCGNKSNLLIFLWKVNLSNLTKTVDIFVKVIKILLNMIKKRKIYPQTSCFILKISSLSFWFVDKLADILSTPCITVV